MGQRSDILVPCSGCLQPYCPTCAETIREAEAIKAPWPSCAFGGCSSNKALYPVFQLGKLVYYCNRHLEWLHETVKW